MHTTSTLILILAVFGASSVEMVEALTIVVAAGVSRGWRSALEGAATAVVVLALLVGFIGVPLIHYVPIDTLRVVVGALLLVSQGAIQNFSPYTKVTTVVRDVPIPPPRCHIHGLPDAGTRRL